MVDALGGVDICVPEAIEDRATGLNLPAGDHHLDGVEATQFVRARKSIGNGSDIGRIDRQQAFLSAVVREATSSELLLRPDRLLGFLDAATQSLTTDEAIASPRALSELALQMRRLPTDQIRFVTVPNETYEPDPNRVIWTDDADALWEAARQDLPLPGTEPTAAPTSTAPTSTAPPTLTAEPGRHVRPGGQLLRRRAGWRGRPATRSPSRASRSPAWPTAPRTSTASSSGTRSTTRRRRPRCRRPSPAPPCARTPRCRPAATWSTWAGAPRPWSRCPTAPAPSRCPSSRCRARPGPAVGLRLDPDLRRPRRRRRHLRLTAVPAHEEGPRTSVRGPCSFSLCGGGGI